MNAFRVMKAVNVFRRIMDLVVVAGITVAEAEALMQQRLELKRVAALNSSGTSISVALPAYQRNRRAGGRREKAAKIKCEAGNLVPVEAGCPLRMFGSDSDGSDGPPDLFSSSSDSE